jgi:hypothetical protein
MRKLASALAALFFAATLSTGAVADNMHMGHGMGHGHKCPQGQHWVKGYKKKNGQKVHGYCR